MTPRLELDQANKTQILQHIEKLSEKLEGCSLSESRLAGAYTSIKKLSETLDVSSVQAILFTAILSLNFKHHPVSIDHISNFLGIPGIKLMQYLPDLADLQKKRWIRGDSESESKRSTLSDLGYYVSKEVYNRLNEDESSEKAKVKRDIFKVLSDVMELADDFSDDNICHSEMLDDVREILQTHLDLPFIKTLKEQRLTEAEELIFLLVCQRTLQGDPEVDLEKLVQISAGSSYKGIQLKRTIIREQNRLLKLDLIKLQEGMFRSFHEVLLTDYAVELFFPEDVDILINKSMKSGKLVKTESIQKVQLFFNKSEQDSLKRLKKLLTKSGYKDVVGRMKKQGMRSGFSILFHGTPGTGKTEAVNQLARMTGREVMRVDLSQTKSKWYGESEKKIAEIFAQYRQLQKLSEVTPILLFNEADGIFGRRVSTQNTPSSQTFNTMQNILLEEMESFEGILVATTNLTSNFDKAFERRFLYKIEFSKPDVETREKIWQSKIEEIAPSVSRALASEFDFSGGQIENITRKFMIDRVLSAAEPSYARLSAYCKEELLHKTVKRRLGFQRSTDQKAS